MTGNQDDNTWIEDITPEQAQAYLLKNKNNRPLRTHAVDKFAQAMRLGQWVVTHQGIGFDVDGNLVDGQHRLAAIVKTGLTVKMRVTLDLPREAMTVLDTGMKRTQGQILHMRGTHYASAWAALLNSVQKLVIHTNRVPLSVVDLERALTEEADMVEQFTPLLVDPLVRVSWLSAPFFFAMRRDPAKIVAFVSKYISGSDLSDGDPIYALRKLFIEGRGTRAYTSREKSLRVLSALRFHLQGERVVYTHVYATESNVNFFATPYVGRRNPDQSVPLLTELCLLRLNDPTTTGSDPSDAPARRKKGKTK